ncbi:MAG: LysR family transcriptional regulator [Gammaproteobacteria bacterium]|uniref:LysR substrate-binding domain-containing protein n=1 Tax=Vreelandella venusta TaxID=44935 RepID=UPI002285F252|nr:LysR substrate-binding domain-containing protein [Halomonas venusta]MBR9924432.1 LysR family transcriptional regulator [Gammaproteobacteria bacterium]MDX1355761.1 LysR substrate-binding domain-containing protein [Halomonas venusta]MDX1713287.1 LysR substrate-binding domain-containing protein [Halomonas venusta]WAM54096.1 LysR substrate-binding domain-containing protein [Halomonas venusta]
MGHRRLPSLSSLRAFEAAARHESAKQAAQELSVTATAISHQVRGLEEALGVPLFLRKPRQLELTAQGRELQQVLETAFDSISSAVERLSAVPVRQTITLSTTPAIAVRWLLPWVCMLRDAHPDIDLRIHATHEPVALDGVTADLAVRYGDGRWPGLVAEKLLDNTFIPACSPYLGLHDIAQLPGHSLIHFRSPGAVSSPLDWSVWQKLAKVPGLDVSAGLVFSDETHVISAAVGAQGVALMSRQLIQDELEEGRLVQPFGPEFEGKPFFLVYPESRRHDPTVLAIRDWVLAVPGGLCSLSD